MTAIWIISLIVLLCLSWYFLGWKAAISLLFIMGIASLLTVVRSFFGERYAVGGGLFFIVSTLVFFKLRAKDNPNRSKGDGSR